MKFMSGLSPRTPYNARRLMRVSFCLRIFYGQRYPATILALVVPTSLEACLSCTNCLTDSRRFLIETERLHVYSHSSTLMLS